MDEDFDFNFPMEIDFERILNNNSILPMVRLLAADLMKNPYMSIGTFLQRARAEDLQLILEASEDEEDETIQNPEEDLRAVVLLELDKRSLDHRPFKEAGLFLATIYNLTKLTNMPLRSLPICSGTSAPTS